MYLKCDVAFANNSIHRHVLHMHEIFRFPYKIT